MRLKVIWTLKAENDLNSIFEKVKEKTLSKKLAQNVVNDIFETSTNIHFIEQYQVDEFLGKPYRRIIIRNYKSIYVSKNENEILILHVFNTFQSPSKLLRE
jgi:plasmid stabilization system protein ParE